MQFGFVVPHADARDFAELAALGERHGWDGIFIAEVLYGVDAWISLAAAAMVTETIKVGTLLTPVPRLKPWDLASKVATVDRLSGGRAILSAGLGALHEGWVAYEDDEGRKVRAEKLDEALAVYAGLVRGQPFEYHGKHYRALPNDFGQPPPTPQRPHPPVWVVGAYTAGRDRQPSLERAARWQGVLPQVISGDDRDKVDSPEGLAAFAGRVRAIREDAGLPWDGYDVVLEADSTGEWRVTTPSDPRAWSDAGATWWVESWWSIEPTADGLAETRRRVAAGPPA